MLGGFFVALPVAAVLWVIRRKINPRGQRGGMALAWAIVGLTFVVGCGLAFTILGHWVANGLNLFGNLAAMIGGPSAKAGLFVAAGLGMFCAILADVVSDRKADKIARYSALLFPTIVTLVIGGRLGANGSGAVEATYNQASAFISMIGG